MLLTFFPARTDLAREEDMLLNEAFAKILREYPAAMVQPFAGSVLAGFIRRDVPHGNGILRE